MLSQLTFVSWPLESAESLAVPLNLMFQARLSPLHAVTQVNRSGRVSPAGSVTSKSCEVSGPQRRKRDDAPS